MTTAVTVPMSGSKVQQLDALYREHAPAALRLALLLTGDKARAEDLVQDAFLRAGSRLGVLRDPERFGAYLRKAVVNATRNAHRHRQVVDRYLTRQGPLVPQFSEPDDLTTRDALWSAIQHLPARQREVIVCRFYLDLSERNTADALGCSPGTVKSSLSRGLDALRAVLQKEDIR